MKKNSYNNIRI